MDDTSVYLALGFFERRRSFGTHSPRVRRDIKAFWGSYKAAKEEAQRLLFSIADTEVIRQACLEASLQGLGYLDGEHSLTIHTSLANELPATLRVYLGCASKLYGEVEETDLIKLHIQSGKVSLMLYDDFEGKVLPLLIERVKINLRRQHIDFFEYGETFAPQPLYLKSRYLYAGFPHYRRQQGFDERIGQLDLFAHGEHGPTWEVLQGLLPDGFVIPE
jgi:DNA phosphorothioation-associated putative methyltransferase